MSISLIVAASANNAIGKNGQLLWHLPNDLRFFKNTTWGMAVVMGRKTFEAVNKPLPGRTNIVISRDAAWQAPGTQRAGSLEEALQLAATTNCKEIFIIGGGEVYHQAMPLADTVYLTRVHAELEGDTFFPELDESEWRLDSNEDFAADEKHAHAFSIQVWKRKTQAL
jgi:dihydrofolate reductase